MQTTLDCLPCLFRQALRTVRLATPDEAQQKMILDHVARMLPEFTLAVSPPENASRMYRAIAALADCPDPYAGIKTDSNDFALRLLPRVREQVLAAPDPVAAAVRFAIAGNIIDYGVQHEFDATQAIAGCLARELAINDFAGFMADMSRAENILYLADNCGEIVFDGLLIELLNKRVTMAVKEKPVINDALPVDARQCKLDRLCDIIANGTDCPGTPLARCSTDFLERFNSADLIISKGQGNFETLAGVKAPIYFLLTVKCQVVARHITAAGGRQAPVRVGDMVLVKNCGAQTVP